MSLESCIQMLVDIGIPLGEAEESCQIAFNYAMEDKQFFSAPGVFLPDTENAKERYILSAVLIPNHVDSWGTMFPPTTVKNAAFQFMINYQENKFMHMLPLGKEDVSIVESYIAPIDMEIQGRLIRRGTWMMGLIIHSEVIWDHIKRGTLTGFSIGASMTNGLIKISLRDSGAE
jgi:hypothetical protein